MKNNPWDPIVNLHDLSSLESRRPLLIAHRGGVLAPHAPENSMAAISLAADYRYDLVELDVREAIDGAPVLYHDMTLERSCGLEGRVEDYSSEELTKITYLGSTQHIITLEQALGMCRELGLGVMLDIKPAPRKDVLEKLGADKVHETKNVPLEEQSASFYDKINTLIDDAGLEKSCVTIADGDHARDALSERCLLTVAPMVLAAILDGADHQLDGYFWFGMRSDLPENAVERLHEVGALVIPAMNTFRYPAHAFMELARRDVEACLQLGVDGFQIDSVYTHFFTEGIRESHGYCDAGS
jgi:glycerophosphoryl diester phosphodiesterase